MSLKRTYIGMDREVECWLIKRAGAATVWLCSPNPPSWVGPCHKFPLNINSVTQNNVCICCSVIELALLTTTEAASFRTGIASTNIPVKRVNATGMSVVRPRLSQPHPSLPLSFLSLSLSLSHFSFSSRVYVSCIGTGAV